MIVIVVNSDVMQVTSAITKPFGSSSSVAVATLITIALLQSKVLFDIYKAAKLNSKKGTKRRETTKVHEILVLPITTNIMITASRFEHGNERWKTELLQP